MIVNKVILNSLLKRNTPASITQAANYATGGFHDERYPIGKREWVGYGVNSTPHYIDRPDYPMPAVRFKEITGDLVVERRLSVPLIVAMAIRDGEQRQPSFLCVNPLGLHPLEALKEKEKGDWKMLSIEEKKTLYRASFRQTLAEVDAPTGEWKSVVGWSLVFLSLGMWLFIIEKKYMYQPRGPTFTEEWRAKMLRKMIDNKTGHLTGVSSKWDYEKDDWKK